MKKTLIVTIVLCLLMTAVLGITTVSAAGKGVYGDVNDDGKINNKDMGLLQQYINGYDVVINEELADVTHDDKVSNKDLGLLQQYINGYDVTLEPDEPVIPDDNIYNDTELEWD